MHVHRFLDDEDAVSPVIGVVLMVAVAVTLVAVIGAFVLGVGTSQDPAPHVEFEFSGNASGLTVAHNTGESFESDNVEFGGPAVDRDGNIRWNEADGDEGRISPGDSVEIDGDDLQRGVLLVIWSPEGSSDTEAMGEHFVPGG